MLATWLVMLMANSLMHTSGSNNLKKTIANNQHSGIIERIEYRPAATGKSTVTL